MRKLVMPAWRENENKSYAQCSKLQIVTLEEAIILK